MDCGADKKPTRVEEQEIGKELRVVARPCGHGRYAPSIRVAGKWLADFGFEMDDVVVLTAQQGEINIKRKDKSNENKSLNDRRKNGRAAMAWARDLRL